jgi:hydroxypyruvate isomerase
MRSILQSAAWWCFVPSVMTPETFVRTMADIGYAAVDLPPQEHWPLIKQHGLAISAIGGHRSLTAGLNRRDLHDGIVAEIEANLRLAEAWGIPNLLCFSGNRNGLDDATGAAITAEGLARVAPAAEAACVTLLL